MEDKSNTKDVTTIDDSTKISKYVWALQIFLLVLAIPFGVTLAFYEFYVDYEDATTLLRDPKFQIEVVSPSLFSMLTRYIHHLILHNPDNWNLTFSGQNPNKNYDFYYNDFKANISYTNTVLWCANVSDKVHQEAKAQTLIASMFTSLPEAYAYWIGTSIAGDLASGQAIRFSVSLNRKIQISDRKSLSHTSYRELHVSCGGLRVETLQENQTGELALDSKSCVVTSQYSTC